MNFDLLEAVADITWLRAELTHEGKAVRPQDQRQVISECIQWAMEFHRQNLGREWDGDYLVTIEAFVLMKLSPPKDPIRAALEYAVNTIEYLQPESFDSEEAKAQFFVNLNKLKKLIP